MSGDLIFLSLRSTFDHTFPAVKVFSAMLTLFSVCASGGRGGEGGGFSSPSRSSNYCAKTFCTKEMKVSDF